LAPVVDTADFVSVQGPFDKVVLNAFVGVAEFLGNLP